MADEEAARAAIEQIGQTLPHRLGIVLEWWLPGMPQAGDAAENRDAADHEVAGEDVSVRQEGRDRARALAFDLAAVGWTSMREGNDAADHQE